ncbi:hypothetical protein [Chitinophaga sp. 212800010-3]|uniref:hypothetical protein n=1 Tax=unclassified Chitinophaga TaxID=2619133 RepID=UPI002DE711CD|nr:hypothetical protein [Chitinophaga sp. 212800010-3]
MFKPKLSLLPKIVLRIESDDTNFTPNENIPVEFHHLFIAAAGAFFTQDDHATILCQTLKLNEFSLWTHEIFALDPIMLISKPCRDIFALHFMASSSIRAETKKKNKGPFMMNGREVNLFKLKGITHKTPLYDIEHLFSFHINITPEGLAKLAEKHPELQILAGKKIEPGSGPVNAQPYKMNPICQDIINRICQCKHVEQAGIVYLNRCCLNLYINFANQDKQGVQPMRVYSKEIETALPAALEYLSTNLSETYSLAKMAYLLDVNAQALEAAFESTYFITPETYRWYCKMEFAFLSAVTSNTPPEDIAQQIGMSDLNEFIGAFNDYYNYSFFSLRNAQ